MLPPSRMTLVAARVVKKMESTFSRIVRCHWSSDISDRATSCGGHMPALPTKMSRAPSWLIVASTRAFDSASVETSAAKVDAVPPSDRQASATFSASALRVRYPTMIFAPALASWRQTAAPIPREPPVTRAHFPERSISEVFVIPDRITPIAERLLGEHYNFWPCAYRECFQPRLRCSLWDAPKRPTRQAVLLRKIL